MTEDFRTYYDIEAYLFSVDFQERFLREGKLDAFELFSNIIWKANRAKSKLARRLIKKCGDLEVAASTFTTELIQAVSPEAKLFVAMEPWGFYLPMASAILSVLWPTEFTVYDFRVCEELGAYHSIGNLSAKKVWPKYCEYRDAVRKAVPNAAALRDKDRFLWGRSAANQLVSDIKLGFPKDPGAILRARGFTVDRWQTDVLLSRERQLLLNCCRQAGKSTVVSALALHTALFQPASLTLILSPGQRQSSETFKKVIEGYSAIGRPLKADYETQLRIELANGSRILCMPGVEETVRCYSPQLIIIDEAARVPDDLYRAIRPMLAVSHGRLVVLSTPFGQRGWFYDEWQGSGPFHKVRVTWHDCPRITGEFIAEEERALGRSWVAQEYECSFEAMEGLVYPDFAQCVVDMFPPMGKPVGGIDWGWRNPFAAIWGVLDSDDVLWLQDEVYRRETPLHELRKAIPKRVQWWADPAGPTEIQEFRRAGFVIRKGFNDIRLGIAAVTARIRTGRLKVCGHRCPNLLAEAKLYRYPSPQERALIGERPIDENNHALGALRYMISRLDTRFIAKLRGKAPDQGPVEVEVIDHTDTQAAVYNVRPKPKQITLLDNEDVWEKLI